MRAARLAWIAAFSGLATGFGGALASLLTLTSLPWVDPPQGPRRARTTKP